MSVLSEYFDTLTLLEVMTDRDICNEKENKKKKQQQANKTNRQTKNEKQKNTSLIISHNHLLTLLF